MKTSLAGLFSILSATALFFLFSGSVSAKQRDNCLCSISQVYVMPSDLQHGGFDYSAIKFALEEFTWIKVTDVAILMPKQPSAGTGTVQLIELGTGGYQSRSYNSVVGATGESGTHVTFKLRLMDAKGNVLWEAFDSQELDGVEATANADLAEAHEVHAHPESAAERLARRLNKEAHCGRKPTASK